MVGVGRHRGTWARWYGGQQLAPDGQKLAGPAATEGLLFFSIVLLRRAARSRPPLIHPNPFDAGTLRPRRTPRARHDPDRV